MTAPLEDLLLGTLISLALGGLIGLEREYARRVVDKEQEFAGVRTYAFVTFFGFLSAYLASIHGEVVLVASLSGLIALVIATYVMTAKDGSYGITTELAGILAFMIGAVVFRGEVLFAVIATVVITSVLSVKLKLHSFVATLTGKEIRALVQFVIISAIILPLLPDEDLGPNGIWDPHSIWMMVILVTGISLAGYLLAKVLGGRKGILLASLVGGLVSSTAVTLSVARRTRAQGTASSIVPAVSIVGATAVLYPRILLETWLFNRDLALRMVLPITFITLSAMVIAYLMYRKSGPTPTTELPLKNPLNFGTAIQFGLVYMAVLWLMDLVSANQSAPGLYAASALFGATDMDAITLSIAKGTPGTSTSMALTAVLLATLSNTAMKFLIVVFFGNRSLWKWVAVGFGVIALATLLSIWAMRWMAPGA